MTSGQIIRKMDTQKQLNVPLDGRGFSAGGGGPDRGEAAARARRGAGGDADGGEVGARGGENLEKGGPKDHFAT